MVCKNLPTSHATQLFLGNEALKSSPRGSVLVNHQALSLVAAVSVWTRSRAGHSSGLQTHQHPLQLVRHPSHQNNVVMKYNLYTLYLSD